MRKHLAIGAGALLVVLALLWFLVLEPERETVVFPPAELLADGKGHFERKEYDLAVEVLQKVPGDSPESAEALYYQGSSNIMLKDYEAATKSLEQALALNPRDTGTLYALGVASYRLGNVKLAKGYFGSVLEINPNDEQAKGLYDILARLERASAEEPDEAAEPSEEGDTSE